MMKTLLFLVAATVGGIFAYEKWLASGRGSDARSDRLPWVSAATKFSLRDGAKSSAPERRPDERGAVKPVAIAVGGASAGTRSPAAASEFDPAVKSRVLKMFREWKYRNAGTEKKQDGRAYKIDMADLLSEIKLIGPHTEVAIRKLMVRILREEVGSDEVDTVVDAILEEARRDGSIQGHHRTNASGSR